MIGVSGVNFYVGDPGNIIATQDCDLLAEPKPKNILKILQTLEREGYELESNGEPLGPADLWLANKIIQHGAVVKAKRGLLRVDVVLEGGKIPYVVWERGKRAFAVGGLKIYVGSLSHLIQAKENSNRDKDRKFLALYKIQLKEMLKAYK